MEFNKFNVVVFGEISPYNDLISKARCRIFYKGGNRNGSYITDEFAEHLLKTLPYTPTKGIFEDGDYTDHGNANTEGKIYGIVPQNPNVTWEVQKDEDGIEREYACADVLLFTSLYPEANNIVGKSLSMELYPPSLKYHYEVIEGQKYAVFDGGHFYGLQVLGDNVEPCFEGAGFFSLIEQLNRRATVEIEFKLSDSQKHSAIWHLLNPNSNEEGGWKVDFGIAEIYDAYALVYNYEEDKYYRVFYTKDDGADTITLGDREQVFIVDVNAAEKVVLDQLQALNGGNYDALNSTLEKANETLEDFTKLQAELEQKDIEINTLREYKLSKEKAEKEALIDSYACKISDDKLSEFKEKIDSYTLTDLDKDLFYELKNNAEFKFDGFVPNDESVPSDLSAILSQYDR